MWRSIFLAALVATVSANVQFQDCGSLGVVLSIRIDDCSFSVCDVVRGTNVSVALEFVNEIPVTSLESLLTVDEEERDLEGVEKNVCNALSQGDCPLGGGEFTTYSVVVPMLETYKRGVYDLEWKFLNEQGGMTVCVKFTVDFEYIGY